tara:strand:+ start:1447 stop:1650 length:204 start_codon:yes stop_codon:yes gene_type:complete
MTKKTSKPKEKAPDHELDALKNLSETIKIVELLQQNMLIMDKNIQYACDKIEEMDAILSTVKGRMGL